MFKELQNDGLMMLFFLLCVNVPCVFKKPGKISYKSSFYSLASLVIFCMLNTIVTEDNKNDVLAPIYTSKLYWAVLRMLEKNPNDRFYLII